MDVLEGTSSWRPCAIPVLLRLEEASLGRGGWPRPFPPWGISAVIGSLPMRCGDAGQRWEAMRDYEAINVQTSPNYAA